MTTTAALVELGHIVGDDHLLVDADLRRGYESDWTARFSGSCAAVVRPGATAEVAAIVEWARRWGVGLVPQGGNTGLVAGAVPEGDSVVVSTIRLASIGEVDRIGATVTAGAGAVLADVQAAVRGSGWEVPVDIGARSGATLGGLAATNAGGTRVLRYGSMRANVVGVEAVLGTGATVRRLAALRKDNTGYDLMGLLCGSEGTLGIITAVVLRLVPAWPDRVTTWIATSGWEDAQALAATALRSIDGLDGLEAVEGRGLLIAGAVVGGAPPLALADDAVGLLVEWRGAGEAPAALVELTTGREHVVADGTSGSAALWAWRELQAEAIARLGVPHKFDVTFPTSAVAHGVAEVRRALADAAPTAVVHVFGHLGDGNVHVNVIGLAPDNEAVDDLVLGVVARCGGSISAEHGIGRAKAPWLHLARSPGEIDAMRGIKRALDPDGIMNPGAVLRDSAE